MNFATRLPATALAGILSALLLVGCASKNDPVKMAAAADVVAGVKAPSLEQTAALNIGRMGVCFNYQMPQAESSTRTPNWHKDFSESGIEPLAGLDPAADPPAPRPVHPLSRRRCAARS